jgi:hypothetical protein
MPTMLVNFSRSLQGKIFLLALTIVVTLYNRTGGIIMAMLIIFLSEFNYEYNNGILFEGFATSSNQINAGSLNYVLSNPKARNDQLTVQQKLQPRDSANVQ